jgi:catechol 2,3-dioxygenase-like lactoylglutathione lyase family enzyme
MSRIIGAHLLLYSTNAEADRAFVRDVLGFKSVDVGHGWLIFGMSPAELAVHPANEGPGDDVERVHAGHKMLGAHLYLMCDDLQGFIKSLEAKKVSCTEVEQERWGYRTTIKLPSGGELGLYQPTHPTALDLK